MLLYLTLIHQLTSCRIPLSLILNNSFVKIIGCFHSRRRRKQNLCKIWEVCTGGKVGTSSCRNFVSSEGGCQQFDSERRILELRGKWDIPVRTDSAFRTTKRKGKQHVFPSRWFTPPCTAHYTPFYSLFISVLISRQQYTSIPNGAIK